MLFLAGGFALVPALIGAFWGAPLVARELEQGTHRLVWNQSAAPPLAGGQARSFSVAAALVAGVLGALLTWAATPVDRVAGDRFSTVLFGARGIAPVGYAVFGLVLGVVAGLLLRRTLPAMAVVFLAVVVVQLAVPNLLRPHYLPPERVTVPMTADTVNRARTWAASPAHRSSAGWTCRARGSPTSARCGPPTGGSSPTPRSTPVSGAAAYRGHRHVRRHGGLPRRARPARGPGVPAEPPVLGVPVDRVGAPPRRGGSAGGARPVARPETGRLSVTGADDWARAAP
ncbi:hypothetical protein V2I01_38495 [Micromonospora sp. BRA006-A]|nr:hypothetical protein [Micromonospora sp. BRA006-A]